ncbi:F0F1 ATP synthase subunit B [Sphingomonas sp. LY29]|uniref:F0F1 ATP synthase subunit B family protein n=1 Tax=unclassified Sphingomonas TaxID=196159 RepID=UPI002ADEBE8A|nr:MULTISPECIES: F0F1 ATP synthase subunit B [unclassified Sphingomonas]MEA1071604.1 F0F1 ATP synthase subunit B [Sphingomonas sp. LY160]WRP25719.1 F0F1 ATP synthase subunit B [Sphingomonas sp. LY29]
MAEPQVETETHAGAEVPGAAHGSADPVALGFDASMLVALAMVVVLVILFWKKVPSAIGKSLDKKIDAIREQLAEAETLRKDAEALKAEYEAKARAADADAAAMVERAHHEAEAIVAKASSDAEALIARRQAMAEAKIGAEERAAIDQLRATAASAAAAAAAKLIADRNDQNADKALVDQAIAGLGR